MSQTLEEMRRQVNAYKKSKLQELLSQCTQEQQAFFNHLYGNIDVILNEKINEAILQCENTIETNKAGE